MKQSNIKASFLPTLKQFLTNGGYKWRGGGIYMRGDRKYPADWLSVSGNNYFCVVNAGVVFPDISAELTTLLPPQKGIAKLGGFDTSILPFVFSPLQHYVALPSNLGKVSADQVLTPADAEDLAGVACGPLLQALLPFHSMDAAIREVRATLGTGHAKSFLLVLAYIKQGQADAAGAISKEILGAMKAEAVRAHYAMFLRNTESKYGVSLTSAS